MRNHIIFGFGLSLVTSLHNFYASYKFLNEAVFVDNVKSLDVYIAGLIILSALLGLAGAFLVNMNKKSGAYVLTSAALVCIVQKVLGYDGTFPFWWIAGYSFSSAAAFNKINMGIDISGIKNYYRGRTIPAVINTAREIAEDINSGELTKNQADWAKQVHNYIDKYGFIAYYGYIFAETFCITIALMCAYLAYNKYPLDDVLSRSLKWGGALCILILLSTEAQRRHVKQDDILKP
ncbi:MAG: hypothetical protein IJU48_06615 [Synergistaceae bacterium]|nr:hypothetical protein [Synergistaceae bacterium]